MRAVLSDPMLATPATRNLADSPTPAERRLEAAFGREAAETLADLYRLPLRRLWSEAQSADVDAAFRWLLRFYGAQGDTLDAFRDVIDYWLQIAFNIGGQYGLGELGSAATFELTNREIIGRIRDHAADLASPTGAISLIRTTANDIARRFVQLRDAEGLAPEQIMLRLLDYGAERAATRAPVIAETESVRLSRQGANETYRNNGVVQIVHETQEDEMVCEQCAPLNGNVYDLDAIPPDEDIPVHSRCRCFHRPLLRDWEPPAELWTGGALPGA